MSSKSPSPDPLSPLTPVESSDSQASDRSLPSSTTSSAGKKRPAKRRKSVQNLIDGFELLRAHIPASRYRTSMSRIETLRLAILRIKDLTYQLQNDGDWPEVPRYVTEGLQQVPSTRDTRTENEQRQFKSCEATAQPKSVPPSQRSNSWASACEPITRTPTEIYKVNSNFERKFKGLNG